MFHANHFYPVPSGFGVTQTQYENKLAVQLTMKTICCGAQKRFSMRRKTNLNSLALDDVNKDVIKHAQEC